MTKHHRRNSLCIIPGVVLHGAKAVGVSNAWRRISLPVSRVDVYDGGLHAAQEPSMNPQRHTLAMQCHNEHRARAGGFGALCTTPSQYGSSLATGLFSEALVASRKFVGQLGSIRDVDR